MTAVSGDRLQISVGFSVKLKDVGAPPLTGEDSTCVGVNGAAFNIGSPSRDALAMLVGGNRIVCTFDAFDVLESIGATCYLPDKTDLNARVVEQGWAVGRAGSAYDASGAAAKTAKRGLWGACPELAAK